MSEQTNHTFSDSNSTEDTISRRSLLKAAPAAVVGTAGLATESEPAAAQFGGFGGIPELDFSSGTPSVDEAPQGVAEIVFNIHGLGAGSVSTSQAAQFAGTAESVGYDESVAAVTWSGFTSGARNGGERFGAWLDEYTQANPETTIRVVGHSMGAIASMAALDTVEETNIDTIALIGGYLSPGAVCEGGQYYDAIRNSAGGVYNYHSQNDSIATIGSSGANCDGGLGIGGGFSLGDSSASVGEDDSGWSLGDGSGWSFGDSSGWDWGDSDSSWDWGDSDSSWDWGDSDSSWDWGGSDSSWGWGDDDSGWDWGDDDGSDSEDGDGSDSGDDDGSDSGDGGDSGDVGVSPDGTPANYYDVDVTDSVSSHTGYKSSEECVSQIVENFN